MQQKNLFLFVVLTALILLGWMGLSRYLWPPPPPKETQVAKNEETDKADEKKKADDAKVGEKKDSKKPDEKKGERKKLEPLAADLENFTPTRRDKLLTLGDRSRDSRFHLFVE